MSCSSDANLFFNHDLSDPKDWSRLIKTIERFVRGSPEYKCWARWAKGISYSEHCKVCNIEYIYSPVETHHYPKNLFSIVEDVLQLNLDKLDKFRVVQLADMVNVEHLKNKVSFVNLCKSCHERFHNGDLPVIEKVRELYLREFKPMINKKTKRSIT